MNISCRTVYHACWSQSRAISVRLEPWDLTELVTYLLNHCLRRLRVSISVKPPLQESVCARWVGLKHVVSLWVRRVANKSKEVCHLWWSSPLTFWCRIHSKAIVSLGCSKSLFQCASCLGWAVGRESRWGLLLIAKELSGRTPTFFLWNCCWRSSNHRWKRF